MHNHIVCQESDEQSASEEDTEVEASELSKGQFRVERLIAKRTRVYRFQCCHIIVAMNVFSLKI